MIFCTLEFKTIIVRSRHYILCTGGIENARILLSNNHQMARGIGNTNDLVGRFLQDHPSAMVGILKECNRRQIQKLFNLHYHGGLKYSIRFSLNKASQEKYEILNATGAVFFTYKSNNALKIISDLKWALKSKKLPAAEGMKLFQLIYRFPEMLVPVYYYLFKKRMVKPNSLFQISIMTEQEPNPESRIYLSNEIDRLGIPIPIIKWQLTNLSLKTTVKFSELIREQFKNNHLGEVQLYEWVRSGHPGVESNLSDMNHHIGTTRMANSLSMGVVDSECRVHGIHNLWIAGSSVFPTSGHSNPTLTLLALTYRIIDKIKQQLDAKA